VTDLGKVRLIGINAPDVGECGYGTATKLAEKIAPGGSTITLSVPDSVRDTDDYGRLLRYVIAAGIDVGLRQIKKGSQAKFGRPTARGAPEGEALPEAGHQARRLLGERRPGVVPAGVNDECPAKAPTKGNRGDEWIYHLPTNKYYSVTNPRSGSRPRTARRRPATARRWSDSESSGPEDPRDDDHQRGQGQHREGDDAVPEDDVLEPFAESIHAVHAEPVV